MFEGRAGEGERSRGEGGREKGKGRGLTEAKEGRRIGRETEIFPKQKPQKHIRQPAEMTNPKNTEGAREKPIPTRVPRVVSQARVGIRESWIGKIPRELRAG